MKLADYIETLDGVEVNSIRYEQVVGIRGRDVIGMGGKVIDRLNTRAKAKALFDELIEQEFGGAAAVAEMLRQEFG
jgi:hypothetical protein